MLSRSFKSRQVPCSEPPCVGKTLKLCTQTLQLLMLQLLPSKISFCAWLQAVEARGCWGLEVIQSTCAECGYPRLTCLLPSQFVRDSLGLSLALLGAAQAPRLRGFFVPKMSAAVKNLKIIPLLVVLLTAGALASPCAPGEWEFLGECQGCGGDMTSLANSKSQDACICNTGYVMTEASQNEQNCDFCGDGRVAPVSKYALTLTRESCKCNAGYAGYDGSEFYFGEVPPCEPCPAGTFKTEIRFSLLLPFDFHHCFGSRSLTAVLESNANALCGYCTR